MNRILAVILTAAVGLVVAGLIVSKHYAARHAAQLAEQQALWQAEKAALEAALAEARVRPRIRSVPVSSEPAAAPSGSTKLSPAEIVAKLRELKPAATARTRTVRQMIYWLEELLAAGPAALPAIRDFLARNEDATFDHYSGGIVPLEFVRPPSLRFGFLDVARQIGGPEAEKLLAEVLGSSGRGVEVFWLARVLQDVAPNKYRDLALNAAHDLLARGSVLNPASPLDRYERENLFNVLTLYADASYANTARTQVLRPDGEVDRSTLKYLQQVLGAQSVALAIQWYDDPRLTDPATKEPFARLALNFVGADAKANEFYQKAINDLSLSAEHRKNLIEDLNQDGFSNRRSLTTTDLPLIQNRLALIEQLAPSAADAVNEAAFKEAYKDLLNMRERATRPPQPAP